ncbi:MAG: MOSC domain-containing protein [bacterium]|nr:MOSC domain-containing protein [bacterium]
MNNQTMQIGKVTSTWIYPFKGMQGIKLPEIKVKSVSVIGDRSRNLDLIRTNEVTSFVDTIKWPKLLEYIPYLVDPSNPKTSEVRVKTPLGHDYSADSEQLIAEIENKLGKKVTVSRMGRAAYHSMPVSLISGASIQAISDRLGSVIDPRVFRMNVYLDCGAAPYAEESWLNKTITFGAREDGAQLIVIKLDERCATINLNPETGQPDPNILKALVKEHGKTLGIYCLILKEGTIRSEDPIYIS